MSDQPQTITIERLPIVPGTTRYDAPEHVVTLWARNRPQALRLVHERMAQLAGRNPGHSSQGDRYVVSDPNGAKWECFALTIAPAVHETGQDHTPNRQTAHEAGAYALGCEDARAAASWVLGGDRSSDHVRRVVAMIDAGDPELDDYLPPMPDLSGQWADARTPRDLFEELTGCDAHAEASWNADAYGDYVDALCTAWEAGVSDAFLPECERILRAAL